MGRCVTAVLRVLGGRALLSDARRLTREKSHLCFVAVQKRGVTMRTILAQLRSLRFRTIQRKPRSRVYRAPIAASRRTTG